MNEAALPSDMWYAEHNSLEHLALKTLKDLFFLLIYFFLASAVRHAWPGQEDRAAVDVYMSLLREGDPTALSHHHSMEWPPWPD